MNKKLMNQLEEESERRALFQRAYQPGRGASFEDTLQRARLRQQGRHRALMVAAGAVLLAGAMGYFLAAPSAPLVKKGELHLQPVAVETPENASKPAASLTPAAPQRVGSVYGAFNLLTQPAGESPSPYSAGLTPMIGLRVEIDGVSTPYKTPLLAPGVTLSAGPHSFVFQAEGGESYGPFWVEVEEGRALRNDFSLLVTTSRPLILDGQEVNKATKTSAAGGALILNTFPLIGLTVVVDGKSTGEKTPIEAPGLMLPAGEHQLEFIGPYGERHGPYTVSMVAGEVTRQRVDLREPQQKSEPKAAPRGAALEGAPGGFAPTGDRVLPFIP